MDPDPPLRALVTLKTAPFDTVRLAVPAPRNRFDAVTLVPAPVAVRVPLLPPLVPILMLPALMTAPDSNVAEAVPEFPTVRN